MPADERAAVVHRAERAIASAYAGSGVSAATEADFTLVGPPTQRTGYVERVERTFARR